MCVRSLSLSHGVARGGKVAFVVSDKKPLCLSCANSKDEMWWNKRERVGSNLNFSFFLRTVESCWKIFVFFSSFSPFCLHKTAKFSYTRNTRTHRVHITRVESLTLKFCVLSRHIYTPQIVSRKWVTLFNDDA